MILGQRVTLSLLVQISSHLCYSTIRSHLGREDMGCRHFHCKEIQCARFTFSSRVASADGTSRNRLGFLKNMRHPSSVNVRVPGVALSLL